MNKVITIELPMFHLEKAFEKAAVIAKERIEDQDESGYTNVYRFRLEHTDTAFHYYDFGERNYYEFTFLIIEQ